MAAKDDEKKIPSTAANAMMRVAKGCSWSSIQRKHQSALALMQGMADAAENRCLRWSMSVTSVERNSAYVSACTFSLCTIAISKNLKRARWVS